MFTRFIGHFAAPGKIAKVDMGRVPSKIPLKEMLAEAHGAFYKPITKKS